MDYERELLQEILKSVDRLDDSVDGINETLSDQNATLKVQAEQLMTHIKRTALLEEEMRPVRAHVQRVNTLMLLLAGILALLGAVKTVIEIVRLF